MLLPRNDEKLIGLWEVCDSVLRTCIAMALACSVLPGQQGAAANRGIGPRAGAEKYPVFVKSDAAMYAAAFIPAAEARHLFAFDISRDYLVFEIGVYPSGNRPITLSPEQFSVAGKRGEPLRPPDPATMAANMQQKNLPKRGSESSATVVAETEIGYESGRDPYTGRHVQGTYRAASVGVGVGADPGAPRMPSPGGYPQDRELLERQLWERMLPEGKFDRPVAGYLYFPASLVKKKAGAYELEYVADHNTKLTVPAK